MATPDPITEIIGDDRTFAAMQRDRLLARGISSRTFRGFAHVDDWVPQRLVTATGANPLLR